MNRFALAASAALVLLALDVCAAGPGVPGAANRDADAKMRAALSASLQVNGPAALAAL